MFIIKDKWIYLFASYWGYHVDSTQLLYMWLRQIFLEFHRVMEQNVSSGEGLLPVCFAKKKKKNSLCIPHTFSACGVQHIVHLMPFYRHADHENGVKEGYSHTVPTVFFIEKDIRILLSYESSCSQPTLVQPGICVFWDMSVPATNIFRGMGHQKLKWCQGQSQNGRFVVLITCAVMQLSSDFDEVF